MTIHRIRLSDLNADFIAQLRAESGSEDAEIAIWLPGKPDEGALSESAFWEVIGLLDWGQEQDDAVILPAVHHLSQCSTAAIQAFQDWLSEKLYLLDGEKYASQTGDNAYQGVERSFSVDGFLYARCYVVARGKAFFEQVIGNPEVMPRNQTFEALLRIAGQAYQEKTGALFNYQPAYIIETFANPDGWPGSDFIKNLLS